MGKDFENQPFQTKMMQKNLILTELRNRGFRITSQRRLLVDIILENDCSCCKEIYYKAVKKDSAIGVATVYRMVKTLEEIGAIDRRNLYKISCKEECPMKEDCVVILGNKEKISLTKQDMQEAISEVLRKKGIHSFVGIDSLVIRGTEVAFV